VFKVSAQATNRYRLDVAIVEVALVLITRGGRSNAGRTYLAVVGTARERGSVDREGKIKLKVPVTVSRVDVSVEGDPVVYQLHVGQLHPVEESSGVSQRLHALGYLNGSMWEVRDDVLRNALIRFQSDNGLVPSGELNCETAEKLRDLYGS
jgi:hypothetical protein